MSQTAEPVRTRPRASEGSTLVLLHPGEVPTSELAAHLVAILFAAASPLTYADAARVLDISVERLYEVCDCLEREPPTGLALQRHADQLQLITAASSAPVVERFLGAPPPVRLSRAALEALAVIAYRQPVTRGDIDAVRGVNSDSAVSTLLSRSLVTEVGRRETVGRPSLLAVTPECLQYLGVRSLEELPPLPDAVAKQASADSEPEPEPDADVEHSQVPQSESALDQSGDPMAGSPDQVSDPVDD